MPYSPKIPCKHPGCAKLVDAGKKYCEDHRKLHPGHTKTSTKCGYDGRWRKARKLFLEVHPLCVECLKNGRYVKATVVDHIIPHRGDPQLFWNQSNWQALCKSCHDHKTMTEDRWLEFKY